MKAISRPPFPFFDMGERGGYAHGLARRRRAAGGARPSWGSVIGVIAWPIPTAEEAMAGSLRRWGQLSPVVACVRDDAVGTARRLQALCGGSVRLAQLTSLSVRVLEVDEPTAKAAILGLNRDQRSGAGVGGSVGRARLGA